MNLNFEYDFDLGEIMNDGDPAIVTFVYFGDENYDSDGDTYSIDPVDLFDALDRALEYCTVNGQFGSDEDRRSFEKVAQYLGEVSHYAWFLLNSTDTARG